MMGIAFKENVKVAVAKTCDPDIALRVRLDRLRSDGSALIAQAPPGASLTELVPVADSGVVTSWAWVTEPRPQQPLSKPFAYALIQLDGAATPLLHVVDAGQESAMKTGMRVRARWADETAGAITDIQAFIPAS
jgi:hypothetical protein